MNVTAKTSLVQTFSDRLSEVPFVALADYRGVSVAEISEFRDALRSKGVRYEVIKNTLALRAIEGTPLEGLSEHLTGMTGWVISGEDPILAAKTLRDATKEFKKAEKFIIKGGFFDGEVIDGAAVGKVADLPSKEELYSMLLNLMQKGPQLVLGVVQAPGRDLVNLLKNYEAKLAE
ncbi:MAG: 50S ribosomal protein L10 [Myxococcota bacterium]|jgi:ribosomal protein L10|nr:50S ribosomal protein L10 [Myxococcota bacterium]